ncbi:hypothetical protein V9L05_13160 [Bernardetia sp. Wsw4-3y2]|uniref:hypothetical protein n=1 Tax=Bernardetia sp. Wsw4-3y2 TaxID=3127471 RepID=UPI0030CC2DDD
MKSFFILLRNITLLVFPFLLMILINEAVRPTITEKSFQEKGIIAINSVIKSPKKCSWACHNIENYCKENHVKILQNYFPFTDPIYFGVIRFLQSTGKYRGANIIVLVILIPLLMYFLLIKSLSLPSQIKKAQSLRQENTLFFILMNNSINSFLTDFIAKLYFYCTDFIINLANILDLSYYEINFFIFCIIYPVLLLGLVFTFCIQKIRLIKIKLYALRQTNHKIH